MPLAEHVPDPVRMLLDGCTVITTMPVQWGDQDAFGHVNNVVYFRWFESARIDLLERFPSTLTMTNQGLGPILASIQCHYRHQLRFPDTVHVGSHVSRVGRTSFDVRYLACSELQQKIVAEGDSVIVAFDYARQRPTRIPDDLRVQLEQTLT